jgi:predicted TPR repeat methyltransferase
MDKVDSRISLESTPDLKHETNTREEPQWDILQGNYISLFQIEVSTKSGTTLEVLESCCFALTNSLVKEFYSKYADVYDAEADKDRYDAPHLIAEWIIKYLVEPCVSTNTGKLLFLDLGCGTGLRYL